MLPPPDPSPPADPPLSELPPPMPQAVAVRAISAIPLAQRSRAICRSPLLLRRRDARTMCPRSPDHHGALYVVNNLQLTIRPEQVTVGDMSETSAQAWTPRGGAFWGGSWRAPDVRLEVRDPEDGTLVGTTSDCSAADVDAAVRAVARSVRDVDAWPLWQRREALTRAAALLVERSELFANLISREGCKPVRDAGREATRAIETVRLSAEQ